MLHADGTHSQKGVHCSRASARWSEIHGAAISGARQYPWRAALKADVLSTKQTVRTEHVCCLLEFVRCLIE